MVSLNHACHLVLLSSAARGPNHPGLHRLASGGLDYLEALLLGRAGGRSGLRGGWRLPPEKAVFQVKDWERNAFGLLLILSYNYNLTTNNFTTETQSAQRTHRDF
jgi:hypothetical protein